MEQHPVPQNVTTFQFRLIGDMTIKQFGYLAAGAILAYVSYKLPLPFLITWPLAATFGLLGFGFAFVPVEERPMDVWVFSFFKSIYAPTQYIWSKDAQASGEAGPRSAGQPSETDPKNVVAQLFAKRADAMSHDSSAKKRSPFSWLTSMFSHSKLTQNISSAPVAPPSMVPSVTGEHLDINATEKPVQTNQPQAVNPTPASPAAEGKLEEKITLLTRELSTKEASETRILELQKQLTDLMAEKNKMEHEMLTMRARASRPAYPVSSPFMRSPMPTAAPAGPASPQTSSQGGPTIKVITQDAAVRSGLPRLTSVPNVVTGITKDNQGNLLPGVLVTVRDHDDVPLRALKTNKLGQFAASTPLPDGTYLVEVEDPRGRYTFDRAQVTLSGGVVPPLEITAKSQKELTREKLAAEIFGKPNM